MSATTVVHVVSGSRSAHALAILAATGPDRHVIGLHDPAATVVIWHGPRAALRSGLRLGQPLVAYHPMSPGHPRRIDRLIGARADIVVVDDAHTAQSWVAAMHWPAGRVVVLATDDPSAWHAWLERALPRPNRSTPSTRDGASSHGPRKAPCLEPSSQLTLVTAAERWLGTSLLVAAPAGPVERLTGSGPVIWALLGEGQSLEGAATLLTVDGEGSADVILTEVTAFAEQLIEAGLAVPT